MLKFCGVCFNSMDSVVPIAGESCQERLDEKVLVYSDEDFGIAEASGLRGIEINYLDDDAEKVLEALAAGLRNGAYSVRARAVIAIREGGADRYLVALDDIENDNWVTTDGPGSIVKPIGVSVFVAECDDEESMEALTMLMDKGGY